MAVYDVDTDGGGSYSSMSSAVSALPATFSSDNDITCTGATEDSTRVDFTGFDVNGNNLFVYPAAGDEHNLTWDTNLYHIGSTQNFQGILTISVDGVDVTGIQIRNGGNNTNARGIRVNSGVVDVRAYDCLIYADNTNIAGRGIDIGAVAADGNCNIVNNVVFGYWEYGIWGDWGFSGRTIQIYNNTIQDCSITGILLVGPDSTTILNVKNNIVEGSGTSDYSITGTYTLNSNTNLSSDSTSPDGASYYSSAVTFAGAGDWKLSSSDTYAKDTGTTLSSDTYYAFSVDALGTTRPSGSAWDIGAHELIQSSGVTGTGAGSLSNITASASGSYTPPAVSGTASGTLSAIIGSASGTFTLAPITGTASGVLSSVIGDASGTFTAFVVTGTADAILSAITGLATGTNTPPAVTGTGYAVLSAISGDAAGSFTPLAIIGSSDAVLAAITADATGSYSNADFIGSAAGTLTAINATASGTLGISGAAAGLLFAVSGQASGAVVNNITGTVQGILSAIVASGSGTVPIVIVGTPSNTVIIGYEDRIIKVGQEDRTISIGQEDRLILIGD